MKNKIPRKFKKYDKMCNEDFRAWLYIRYGFDCTFEKDDKIIVWNYFGKDVITSDSKSMIVYWLSIFK